jgi:hypothetical protein
VELLTGIEGVSSRPVRRIVGYRREVGYISSSADAQGNDNAASD